MRVLVLSGGGSGGAWSAGYLQALWERGERWDAYVGTSVGSVIACALSYLNDPERVVGVFKTIKSRKDIMSYAIDWPWKMEGVYKFDPLENLMHEALYEGELRTPSYFMFTDFQLGGLFAYKAKGSLEQDIPAVIASSAVPLVHKPHPDLPYCYDGGVLEFAALNFAVNELGAVETDVILTHSLERVRKSWVSGKLFPMFGIASRALELMSDEIAYNDWALFKDESAVTLHAPQSAFGFSGLDYTPSKISEIIELGYKQGQKVGL